MRYKETEKILFKFHSGISDPNDYTIGEVITQLLHGLPEWKEPGEYYYIVKCEVGWPLDEGSSSKVKFLVGEDVFSKLEMGSNYWFVREKNILGKWDGISVVPEMLNFQLLKHKFRK